MLYHLDRPEGRLDWDIGLDQRRGIGHVYSSSHMSDGEAEMIIRRHIGKAAEGKDVRSFKFEGGYRPAGWVRNCVAVGLSGGFFEPLEATGIVFAEVSAVLIANLFPWANGMDGGHVHGLDAIRDYWTRQWSMVGPHVEPVSFRRSGDGAVIAEVIQTIRDLDGNPLQGQTHGLEDKTVGHVFRLREGKVARFDIQDAA